MPTGRAEGGGRGQDVGVRRLLGGCFRNRASYRRRHRLERFFARKVMPRRLGRCDPLFTFLRGRGERTGAASARPTAGREELHHRTVCALDKVTTKLLLLLNVTNVRHRLGTVPSDCIVVSNGYCASRGLIHRRTVTTFHGMDLSRSRLLSDLFNR